MDPQTFQQDASPFAPSRSQNDSPISIPSEFRSRSPPLEHGQHADDAAPSRSSTWKGGGRSYSGFWSNISSTPPTPKSEILSQEALKQQAGDSSGSQYGASSSGGALAVVNVDNPKQRRPKSSSSRVSMFFRSPSSASPINAFASGTDKSSPVAVRSGGVDLLADGSGIGTWEQLPGQAGAGDDGGAQAENTEQSVLMDLWEGIGECNWVLPYKEDSNVVSQSLDSVLQDGTHPLLLALIRIQQNGLKALRYIPSDPSLSSSGRLPGALSSGS